MDISSAEMMIKYKNFLHEIIEHMVEFSGDIVIAENAIKDYDLQRYFYDQWVIVSSLDKPMLAWNIYQNYLEKHDVAFRKFESAVVWELRCRNNLISKQEVILMIKEYGLYDRYLKNPVAFKNLNIVVKMVADEVGSPVNEAWVKKYLCRWEGFEDEL